MHACIECVYAEPYTGLPVLETAVSILPGNMRVVELDMF